MAGLNVAAAGYAQVDGYFTPPILTSAISYAYHQCAITPHLAKSNFLGDQELFCGSRAIFGRETDIEWFGFGTDNNEDPPVTPGPSVDPDAITICQLSKFQIKLSDRDRMLMCNHYDEWIKILERQIDKNIIMEIDNYSLPLILASAHPDNVGKHAGMLNHTVDLGGQGGSGEEPLPTATIDNFITLIDNMIEVSSQAGWFCDPVETATPGEEVANPVLVIPSKLRGLAQKYIRENQSCCTDTGAAYRSGVIGMVNGMDIVVSQRLQPARIAGSTLIAQVLLVDPNQILHAFKLLSNKIWEGKFEQYFVGQYAYDTHVINPYGVIVANAQVAG